MSNRSCRFWLCFLYLRNIEGFRWICKRVYRINRELELNLEITPKRRLVHEVPEALTVPGAINRAWIIVCTHERLEDRGACRPLNVIDDFNREGLSVTVNFSLPRERVVSALNHVIKWWEKPDAIRSNAGRNYIGESGTAWAKKRCSRLELITLGKPQVSAYVELYNRNVRYKSLAQELFVKITQVQEQATRFLWTYNHEPLNIALGGITPAQKLSVTAWILRPTLRRRSEPYLQYYG